MTIFFIQIKLYIKSKNIQYINRTEKYVQIVYGGEQGTWSTGIYRHRGPCTVE